MTAVGTDINALRPAAPAGVRRPALPALINRRGDTLVINTRLRHAGVGIGTHAPASARARAIARRPANAAVPGSARRPLRLRRIHAPSIQPVAAAGRLPALARRRAARLGAAAKALPVRVARRPRRARVGVIAGGASRQRRVLTLPGGGVARPHVLPARARRRVAPHRRIASAVPYPIARRAVHAGGREVAQRARGLGNVEAAPAGGVADARRLMTRPRRRGARLPSAASAPAGAAGVAQRAKVPVLAQLTATVRVRAVRLAIAVVVEAVRALRLGRLTGGADALVTEQPAIRDRAGEPLAAAVDTAARGADLTRRTRLRAAGRRHARALHAERARRAADAVAGHLHAAAGLAHRALRARQAGAALGDATPAHTGLLRAAGQAHARRLHAALVQAHLARATRAARALPRVTGASRAALARRTAHAKALRVHARIALAQLAGATGDARAAGGVALAQRAALSRLTGADRAVAVAAGAAHAALTVLRALRRGPCRAALQRQRQNAQTTEEGEPCELRLHGSHLHPGLCRTATVPWPL